AFVQLALEVAVAPEGLVLVEEPEVYQHPKAIWQTAKVLLANMRRGVQMVITTHSLELIDAILAEASEKDLEDIVLFNLKLENGELEQGRRVGEEIVFARQTLENDLR
ncbi:MAG: AAA family ATPase, partial [Thermoanaerobaculia bacterium]